MVNLISTGNQIGQGIAFVRLIAAVIIGCCFCLVGAVLFTSKPKDEKDNPKQSGSVFMCMGGCAMLLGYLSYLFTKSFKGAGTIYTAYSAYDALAGNK